MITSSPVLAQRDSVAMSKVYAELGLSAAHNCDEDLELRKKAYTSHIVYGDIARFQRDFLLHTFYKKLIKGDRTECAVIVDEVDNMLLDNGNNMLYLSHCVPGVDLLDSLLIFIQNEIYSPLFNGDNIENGLSSAQEEFSNQNIKRKILTDLFGQLNFEDFCSVLKKANMKETSLTAAYEKLIKANIIDSDGYLMIHTQSDLNRLDKILDSIGASYVELIKTCFSVILSRERRIELPVYLRSFAKLHLDELIESSKQALFMEQDTSYVVDLDHTRKVNITKFLILFYFFLV